MTVEISDVLLLAAKEDDLEWNPQGDLQWPRGMIAVDTNILIYPHRNDSEFFRQAGAAVHDARIAAICKTHGVRQLWSADRDFSRIGGVTVVNPLLAT
ncbi:MAG: hypothetical protein M3N54_07880 [Acidobacteriota bacterium]|nr:hypothetical protein [Acidobacteriota bacterium]